jgi:hypothetical protein
MPGVSCEQKFRGLRLGIEPENFFAFGLQQEFHSFGEIKKTFRFGFALTVRAGNFKARRPKTAFTGFALMNYGCELFHANTYTPF